MATILYRLHVASQKDTQETRAIRWVLTLARVMRLPTGLSELS